MPAVAEHHPLTGLRRGRGDVPAVAVVAPEWRVGPGRRLAPAELEEAIGWFTDCWDDVPEDLTPDEIERTIARRYDGGIDAFRSDIAPLRPSGAA